MSNVYDVRASELVKATAEKLKGKIKRPAYLDFVKSGPGKERVPHDSNFWYVRSASILRQIYINGPVGVSRLRTKYGSRKEHVVHRRHKMRSGGSIIRDAMQELEKAHYIKNTKEGRIITPEGRSFMDKISSEIARS